MTVAVVALNDMQRSLLRAQGVKDSKKLSLSAIQDLVGTIHSNSLASYELLISPRRFNEMFREFKEEGQSLNNILAWGHATAIENVLSQLRLKKLFGRFRVVIDEFDRFATEARLRRVLALEHVEVEQFTKAESETSVAAASILARAYREGWLDNQSNLLRFDLRSLTPLDVINRKDANLIGKLSFLRKMTAGNTP